MKILDVREQWIHTHFILDRGDLAPQERTLIESAVRPVLKRNLIQYDYHIVEAPAKGITRLVLECVPLEHVRDEFRVALAAVVEAFPSGPGRNTVTRIGIADRTE